MTLQGIVRNGTIVLEQPHHLPDGTRVEAVVTPRAAAEPVASSLSSLLELAGTVDDLPSDMALNHDHYLHGAPKR
jgi:hypothetical protein